MSNFGVTIHSVVALMKANDGTMDHLSIARRLSRGAWRVCIALNYLQKTGMVKCLKEPERGRYGAAGVWSLTEKAYE